MKTLAVRDDGATLVGEPGLEWGLLLSDGGRVVLPVASALSRGLWREVDQPAPPIRPEEQAALQQPPSTEMFKTATPGLVKAGPHGFIHGWIYVGPAVNGHVVNHPVLGEGHIVATAGNTVNVHFHHDPSPHGPAVFESRPDSTATAHFVAATATAPLQHGRVAVAPKVLNPADAGIWAREHLPSPATVKLTEAQSSALYHYSAMEGYVLVNSYLRDGGHWPQQQRGGWPSPSAVQEAQATLNELNTLMAAHRVPEDLTVFRITDLQAFGGVPPSGLVGKVVRDKGFLSTTVNTDVADELQGNEDVAYPESPLTPVRLALEVPAGTPGFYLDGASASPSEQELLLGAGLPLAVVAAHWTTNNGWEVKAQVVLDA